MQNGGKVSRKSTKLVSLVKPSIVSLLGGPGEQLTVELQPLTTMAVNCLAMCGAEICRPLAAEGL